MDLEDFRKKALKESLNISENYGNIFSYIDFANVNNWFKDDTQTWDNKLLNKNETNEIELKELKKFSYSFSKKVVLYYGNDPRNIKSKKFTYLLRKIFGNKQVITKDLQKIKHYLPEATDGGKLEHLQQDKNGKKYIEIRKCNFDVEIAVDAISMIKNYDTFCIFSGDADFVYLNNFLRKKGKKIIIIKGGYITSKLRETADLVISAQHIKKHISHIRTKT